jgi:hypothetical protein
VRPRCLKSALNFCRRSADTGSQTRVSLPPQLFGIRPDMRGARENSLMKTSSAISPPHALASRPLYMRRVCGCSPEGAGSRTMNREPAASDCSSETSPPWVDAIDDAIASPRPAPLVAEARRSRSDR